MPKPISFSGGAALLVSLALATACATACAKDNVPSSYVCLTAPKDHSIPVAAEFPGPHYPESARDNHIVGWVEVSLTIDRDGHVEHASVVASEPRGFFEEAALAAVKKWRYCPLPKDAPDYTAPIKRRVSFGE